MQQQVGHLVARGGPSYETSPLVDSLLHRGDCLFESRAGYVAEVRVLTSNYTVQYGRNASGTIEVETKSGTNQFHGAA
jgi:hypothetical protein